FIVTHSAVYPGLCYEQLIFFQPAADRLEQFTVHDHFDTGSAVIQHNYSHSAAAGYLSTYSVDDTCQKLRFPLGIQAVQSGANELPDFFRISVEGMPAQIKTQRHLFI